MIFSNTSIAVLHPIVVHNNRPVLSKTELHVSTAVRHARVLNVVFLYDANIKFTVVISTTLSLHILNTRVDDKTVNAENEESCEIVVSYEPLYWNFRLQYKPYIRECPPPPPQCPHMSLWTSWSSLLGMAEV